MHLYIEKGMRGCISYISKSHSEADNKYMDYYDGSKRSKYITYFYANKLYGGVSI